MSTQRPSAVQFFAPDHPRLAITLKAKLEKIRTEHLENLARQMKGNDHNWLAGTVNGIDVALNLCIQTEAELREQH